MALVLFGIQAQTLIESPVLDLYKIYRGTFYFTSSLLVVKKFFFCLHIRCIADQKVKPEFIVLLMTVNAVD